MMNDEEKITKILEINEDLDYLFSKINIGLSFFDARAIKIMNEVRSTIKDLGEKNDKNI